MPPNIIQRTGAIEWLYAPHATAIHLLFGVSRGLRPIDQRLLDAVAAPLHQIRTDVPDADACPMRFWQQLFVEFAPQSTSTIAHAEPHQQENSLLIAPLMEAIERVAPYVTSLDELQMRCRPIQQQWQIYGPGLMRACWSNLLQRAPSLASAEQARRTDSARARAIVVQPIFGGWGCAHLDSNLLQVEAIMINTMDELPEVLRCAWLLFQLDCSAGDQIEPACVRDGRTVEDRAGDKVGRQEVGRQATAPDPPAERAQGPVQGKREQHGPDRLGQGRATQNAAPITRDWLAGLATLPAVLEAGAELGISPKVDMHLMEKAIRLWRWDAISDRNAASLAVAALDWWQNDVANRESAEWLKVMHTLYLRTEKEPGASRSGPASTTDH